MRSTSGLGRETGPNIPSMWKGQAGCTPDSVEAVICLSGLATRGRSWLAGCYPASPSLLRRDRTTFAARPTRLAPGCTLAQPAPLLPPLVGSYPTVSALTGPLSPAACAGIAFCCGCSRRSPFRSRNALTCCFVRQPSRALRRGRERESGSSSGRPQRERPATALQLAISCCQGASRLTAGLYHTHGMRRKAGCVQTLRFCLR